MSDNEALNHSSTQANDSDDVPVIDIFISSPGDVSDERDRARHIVQSLRRRYAGQLDLRPLFWEDLALPSHLPFQDGIDFIVKERGIEIAIFIFWSRLGSPLELKDGTKFRSGTEREFEMMSQSRDQSVERGDIPPLPEVLCYRRDDEAAFGIIT